MGYDVSRFSPFLTIFIATLFVNESPCPAQAADPEIAIAEPAEPVLLIESARDRLSHRDYEQVILIAGQAIAEAPNSPNSYHIRGKAFVARHELSRASDDFLTAHRLFNARARIYFKRYEARSGSGDHEGAETELSAYTVLTKAGSEALDDLGKADFEQSRKLMSELDLRHKVSGEPRDGAAGSYRSQATGW